MRLIVWLLAAVLVTGCTWGTPKPEPVTDGSKLSSADAQKVIAARAAETVNAIKAKDLAKLKSLVHPDAGARFSPYSYVNTSTDLVFQAADFDRPLFAEKRLYHWGTFDGSGEPINLGFGDYWQRFVYAHDFAAAPQVGYNQFLRGGANSTNNAREIYPTAIFVDYHFPG
ncbi:MAG TPA: hypothetical protein VD902_17545, partial [Symbiobacteriaceae bacterium]|nr:hypothetical protein [Symbiobacteriaceae bacterium]